MTGPAFRPPGFPAATGTPRPLSPQAPPSAAAPTKPAPLPGSAPPRPLQTPAVASSQTGARPPASPRAPVTTSPGTHPPAGSARAAVNAAIGSTSHAAPKPSSTGATAPPQVSDADLEFVRDFLKVRSGISLSREKRYLVDSRLGPMARKRGFVSLDAMIQELRLRRPPDLERAVVEAMTTNETLFFRDRQPFELIRNSILPGLMTARAMTRHLRIWCAAASTGQEP